MDHHFETSRAIPVVTISWLEFIPILVREKNEHFVKIQR